MGDVFMKKPYGSATRFQGTGYKIYHGSLAGTVGPNQTQNFILSQIKCHVVHRDKAPEVPGHPVDGQCRFLGRAVKQIYVSFVYWRLRSNRLLHGE